MFETVFEDVPSNVDFPALERAVIDFWRREDVFRKSIEKPSPSGRYVFYEGPPTANGKPGVHHVISRAYKDLFPRFKTMQGYRVGRKGGWDTHGLPVEIAIEKRLGFTNKQQIEDYGIEAFNKLCKEYVFENIQDWNEMTERIGFWLDLENAYVTYDNSYIESCWWVMKELWRRGLLVEDYKTTWHSPSSNTTLASHEVSQGYEEDVEDPSIYPKFPAVREGLIERGLLPADEERPAYFMAWTTTPWTLPANTGLAAKADADYALVAGPTRRGGDQPTDLYILAASLVEDVFGESPHEVISTFTGSRLEGVRYRPIMRGHVPEGTSLEGAWRVVLDDFVSLEDGTGIVHLAPAYGDLDLGREHGFPTIFSVSLTGEVFPDVAPVETTGTAESGEGAPSEAGPYAGAWFKDADRKIIDDLLARGTMFHATTIRHAYPFNWRDGTPLLNYAKKSWYIRTTSLKPELLENNERINWVPDHIRTGRFGKWLENNVDWALSRERYWGAPLPIWESDDGERLCVGSVAELESLTGSDLSDLELHRPYVDDIVFEKDGKTFRRVPYTVDVWFESGAMPYAQWHYLGNDSSTEATEQLADNFPADYICEAIDQTRGWFYSLHALATLLTDSGGDEADGRTPGPLAHLAPDSPAFKNVIVLGHIVDEKGEKMSKSKGNTVDPQTILDAQGADALRWYLYSASPPESTKRFSQGLVDETLRDFFMTLWNTYSFFVLYANLDEPDLATPIASDAVPQIDRWLHAKTHALIRDVTAMLESYDPTGASRAIRAFVVDDLSNWYVRRNRRRFWRSTGDEDKRSAFRSLYHALVTVAKLMAPMAPFTSEELYQNLVRRRDAEAPVSIHLADWPVHDPQAVDEGLLRDMAALQRVVELGRAARASSGHKTRQPLPEVLVRVRTEEELSGLRRLEDQLLDELNVKEVRYLDVTTDFVDYDVKPNLPLLGRRLGPLVPELKRKLDEIDGRQIAANVRAGRATEIELAGENHVFEPEAFLLDARSPEGYEAVEERGYLTALNTTLTPELIREGLARDFVRVVQNARKNADFEVSDRIELGFEAGDELAQAVAEHRETIAGEVLAKEILTGPVERPEHTESAEIEGIELRVWLRRTG